MAAVAHRKRVLSKSVATESRASVPPLEFEHFAAQAYDASLLRKRYEMRNDLRRRLRWPLTVMAFRHDALARPPALIVDRPRGLVLNRGLYALLSERELREEGGEPLAFCYDSGHLLIGPVDTELALSAADTAAGFVQPRSLAIDGCTTQVWVWAAERSDLVRRRLPIHWFLRVLLRACPDELRDLRNAFCHALQLRMRWNHTLLGLLEHAAVCSFVDLLPHVLQYSD